MKRKLLNWLSEFLYPWFIPQEDYALVQRARWDAEGAARQLHDLYTETLDSLYERKYRTFEQLSKASVAKETTLEHMDFQQTEFRFAIRIPHFRFVTMIDPEHERNHIRDFVIQRLAENFKQYMRKQLFKETTPCKF